MKTNERLLLIDALRGFDMFWIIGGDAFFKALLASGAWSFSPMLKEQLEHAQWEGFRFYDLIFPLFLFLVGCVLPFSLAKYRDQPSAGIKKSEPMALAMGYDFATVCPIAPEASACGSGQIRFSSGQPSAEYSRIFRRTVFLFLLGLIYAGLLKFDWFAMRYAVVLQRIAICYCIAAIIFLQANWTARSLICVTILLGYWDLIGLVETDAAFSVFSKEGNLSGYVDRLLLPGKIYEGFFGYGDNEGILSTIPAVVTTLLGVFAGEWLRIEKSR
jgi:predicted acyltransferase